MKTTCCFTFGLALIATAFSRDFHPEGHMENIPASDSSIQECYVFRTLPGVRYRVECSHDLKLWTTEDEIYGLGHEYVVAMREFTPPPPPPEPGTNPPLPPIVPPAKNVSLFIQPSSGAVGGTVVSWTSLDHGGPVKRLLAQSMTSGWNQVPLFWNHYGDFSFFILHAAHVVAPAEESLPLDSQDAALFAELENSFPLMNQAIDESVARARNAPPPAPADPNSHRFWRIHCDWSIDTDQDGSPDWAEFEMAANGTGGMVAGVMGNAFDADINGDGIPDGEQLDSDGDGTADARDIAPDDKTANFEIGPLPRYALFPIANAAPDPVFISPIQINDQGTVLYSTGTWTGGIWKPLAGATGSPNDWTLACRINDLGEIIGTQLWDRGADPEDLTDDRLWNPGNLVYWASPAAVWEFAHVGEDYPEIRDLYDYYPGSPSISFSNSGQLLAYNQKIDYIDEYGFPWTVTEDPLLWTLPGQGRTPGLSASLSGYGGVIDSSHYWGWVYEQNAGPRLFTDGAAVIAPHMIRNLQIGPGGELITCFDSNSDTQVFMDGAWHPSPTFAKAIDMAADGTAIGKAHDGKTAPILLNGKWQDIKRTAPGANDGWNDASVTHLDTTSGGWILASRGPSETTEYAAMLPIKARSLYIQEFLQGVTTEKYTGVDDFSIGTIFTSDSVQDRIWIMAPKGGVPKSVTFTTPVDGVHPLILSASGIDFGNVDGEAHLLSRPSTATLQATDAAESGADIAVDLRFGQTSSSSKPLGIKVMKARTVKVTLYKVTKLTSGHADNTADQVPNAAGLQDYLNDVFAPQINVRFEVTDATAPLALNWDVNLLPDDEWTGNGILDCYSSIPSTEQSNILNARPAGRPDSNIDVFFIGTDKYIDGKDWAVTLRSQGNITENACWIVGDALGNREMGKLLQTIAHEIGHVLVGYGHPDAALADLRGPADLPGTNHSERLMVSGHGYRILRGHMLVKQEWDKAEEWLKNRPMGDN